MKRIIYTRPDGGISVVTPIIGRDDPEGFTEDMAVQRALSKDVPQDATNVRVVDASEIPTDRTFRDAWTDTGGKVDVDMSKAREIHMNRIREVRNRELARLDVEFLRAQERGDGSHVAVAAQKQALRDIPQTFDLSVARTPEELKGLWPSDLPKP